MDKKSIFVLKLQIFNVMKRIIVIAALVFGIAFAASAQPRAIGGRLAYGLEASYQHYVGGENFVEANLGLCYFSALNATATYNFMIAQPAWTARGEWGFYAGPGATVGLDFIPESEFVFGIVGQVGLEYTFWFPLQLSVDLRPQIGFAAGNRGARFYSEGMFGFVPTIGVRYRF